MRLKKFLLVKGGVVTALAMIMINSPGPAQTYNNFYRPSGQNYIYNVNTGNVGIGITVPAALFHMVSEGSAGSPGAYPGSNRLEVCSWAGDGPATDNGVALLAVNAGRINSTDTYAGNAYLVRVALDDGPIFAIKGNGRVGIGTTNPESRLHVNNGGIIVTSDGGNQLRMRTASQIWDFDVDISQSNMMRLRNMTAGTVPLAITTSGHVGIGISTPSSRLCVNGTIRAKEVIVTTQGWPDHVFKPDYTLKPLHEVEKYIKKNNHLEGIPSEKEVMEKGVSMGDMQAKLLQKLEETTLYLIALKKENETMKSQNEQLHARLAALEKRIQ